MLSRLYKQIDSLKKNKTARNGILFTFFAFLNNGIGFLLLIIIASFITPEGYGHLNIFNTSIVLLTFFISLNSTGVISVNFFRMSEIEVRKTINAVFIITIISFCIFQLVSFLFGGQINNVIGLSRPLQIITISVCFFQIITNINLDIWRLKEQPVNYGLYSLSNVVLNFILTIFFIVSLKYGWLGRVYSQVLTAFIFFCISIIFLIKRKYLIMTLPSKSNFKDILSFGIPLIPHNTSFWLRQGLDRYIINFYQNTTLVGLFSFSYNFANIIQIIGTAFNATNSVFIYKNLSKEITEDNKQYIRQKLVKQTKIMISFFICITALIYLCSNLLIPIFFPKYKDATLLLLPQCLGAMFHCIYLLFVNFLFFYKKTKKLMAITFTCSIIHALLSILLTKYSILYTVYIGLFSNFLIASGVFLYSRRIYKLF